MMDIGGVVSLTAFNPGYNDGSSAILRRLKEN
jgi:hypothetical protein